MAPYAKKTPKLESLLMKPSRRRRASAGQTVEQQIAVARQWTAAVESPKRRK